MELVLVDPRVAHLCSPIPTDQAQSCPKIPGAILQLESVTIIAMMDAVSLTPVYCRARHAGPSANYQNLRVLGKCSNFWHQTRGDFAAVAGSFCSVTVLSICLGRLGRHGDHGRRSRLPRGFWTWPWVSDTAKEIKELLLAAKGEELEPSSRRKVEEGIDFLAAARVPCPAELLGDSSSPSEGLWRSVFIQGKIPKWEENARLLKPLVRNKAGQAYDARSGRVTNYGEILGPLVHFVAEGSFTAKDGTGQCPKEFDVEIEQGGLVLFGVPLLSSAISGPGLVRVLYIDEDIRIFESPTESPDRWEEEGLRVIQVREQLYSWSVALLSWWEKDGKRADGFDRVEVLSGGLVSKYNMSQLPCGSM